MQNKIYCRDMIDGVQYTDGTLIIKVQFYKLDKDNSPIYKIFPINFFFTPLKHTLIRNYRFYNYYRYNGYLLLSKPLENLFHLFYENSKYLQYRKQLQLSPAEDENLLHCFTPIESRGY